MLALFVAVVEEKSNGRAKVRRCWGQPANSDPVIVGGSRARENGKYAFLLARVVGHMVTPYVCQLTSWPLLSKVCFSIICLLGQNMLWC